MPTPQLISGEVVLRRMRPHWNTLISPIFWGIVLTWALIWLLTLSAALPNPLTTIVSWTVFGGYALLLLLLTVRGVIRWATTVYVFTNKRISTTSGLIRIQGESIALDRVQSVQFSKTLMERLFGSGKLIVESAADNRIIIRNVTHAEDIYQNVYEAISQLNHPEQGL